MAITAVPALVEVLRHSRLLDQGKIDTLTQTLHSQFTEAESLARELVQQGWLTPYQMEQLLLGKGEDLVLGQYVLMEPVGKGNVGQIYKARHLKRGHVVALKVIRQERRADAQVLRRFRREVRAVTRLAHPNLIKACDIEEVGNAHFYAMEYILGVNLDQLITKGGAMPIAPACDYIRQAALGLQHAHERSLIHRDIKPANLLIAPAVPAEAGKPGQPAQTQAPRGNLGRWGTVKVLDLGLALLQHPLQAGGNTQALTQVGFALGTADYMAPEQVMKPHEVDIRADLYGLGCTFYHMLTGKPPFPQGSLLAKLQAHQFKDAVPVEQLRPDVPPSLAGVIRKLMAKRPEDRYQKPAELADALTRILSRFENTALATDWKLPAELTETLAAGRKRITQMPRVAAPALVKGRPKRTTQFPVPLQKLELEQEEKPVPRVIPVGVVIVAFVLSFLVVWLLFAPR